MRPEVLATYRVQLHAGFTFYDVADVASYLSSLGVTHVYCSPYLQAGAGSTHGYDVLDHTRLNTELGGVQGFETMVAALSDAGLSHIVDIVPNHMAISSRRNRWWWDVLKNGRLSKYATYFDIDWEPPEPKLVDVILMPILGDHYGRVLSRGEITIERDEDELVVQYFDHVLPLSPTSVRDVIEIDGSVDETLTRLNGDPDALHGLLDAQHYRLAYWRTAGDELDYRRFFDINTLVALRQEEPEVFDATHELILDLVRQGSVTGLRVDHIDGLREPRVYLERLREAVGDSFIVVEKILGPEELVPESWPIEGTTGYDFLNEALRLFVDPDGEAALDDLYRSFTGKTESFEDVALAGKTLVTHDLLASDLDRLTGLFIEVCEDNRDYRDFTRRELRECLRATLAAFPVYRTYVEPEGKGATEQDRMLIERAIGSARSARGDLDPDLFELLHAVLLGEVEGRAGSELLLRFQQLSGPVMAKGVEDTAFYNFNRFVASNEVGGDPALFAAPIGHFHERCAARASNRPRSMLATSTHDTKRSEDVRARLCVVSEIPEKWAAAVGRWAERVAHYRTAAGYPDDNAIYLFFQALVGAWPLTVERASAYMEKATKEAKSRTSWIDPDPDYDDAVSSFVNRCFDDEGFLSDVESFVS
nr:malto-oligosyltrehalose synthase [Actinomycetota bacterium]